MYSAVDFLKTNIESGLLTRTLPVSVFSLKAFKDMLQLSFDSHINQFDNRVRVGKYFCLKPNPIIRYGLNVQVDQNKWGVRLKTTWKDGLKPENWLEIEQKLASVYH